MRISWLSAFCVNLVANALVVLIAPALVVAWIVRVRTIEHLQRARAIADTPRIRSKAAGIAR